MKATKGESTRYSSFFQITSLNTLNTNILYECFEWFQGMDLPGVKTTVNLTKYVCSMIPTIPGDRSGQGVT